MSIDGVNWKELETRGFLHLSGFLSPEELSGCRADFANQPVDQGNRNISMSTASDRATARLGPRFSEVMSAITANTGIRVDCNLGAFYFATARGVFPWHQAYESY